MDCARIVGRAYGSPAGEKNPAPDPPVGRPGSPAGLITPAEGKANMPVHTVAAADLESAVATLEQTERIIQVVPAGDGAFHVVTETKPSKRKPTDGVQSR